jgi:hypothetical protein
MACFSGIDRTRYIKDRLKKRFKTVILLSVNYQYNEKSFPQWNLSVFNNILKGFEEG